MTSLPVRHFAVIREAGPGWVAGKAVMEQPAVSAHAAFMSALADEGFVLFGGPLAEGESGRFRALLIVDADGEPEIHRRLVDDPWAATHQLVTVSIDPWTILVGAERLSTGRDAHRLLA
jgi:uncharacterized protein YciI